VFCTVARFLPKIVKERRVYVPYLKLSNKPETETNLEPKLHFKLKFQNASKSANNIRLLLNQQAIASRMTECF
jgi:hypothetical protein